jgi:hypothetical protein
LQRFDQKARRGVAGGVVKIQQHSGRSARALVRGSGATERRRRRARSAIGKCCAAASAACRPAVTPGAGNTGRAARARRAARVRRRGRTTIDLNAPTASRRNAPAGQHEQSPERAMRHVHTLARSRQCAVVDGVRHAALQPTTTSVTPEAAPVASYRPASSCSASRDAKIGVAIAEQSDGNRGETRKVYDLHPKTRVNRRRLRSRNGRS